jgi:predicted RNA-binding protein
MQLGDMSASLELNFVVVQFKSCLTLFKFIKKRVKINSKVLIKGMHDHPDEQVNIMIDGKDMQK